ncbi:MAG: glycosyltransferase family 2 protein [Motiliproteus sp.]|nr:glycosyltransferase family 2 protein [Motiliproteus sp.]
MKSNLDSNGGGVSGLVSFIIPAYNHEKFIEICLNKLLSDSYPLKEIIIIDDGSSDTTKEVIEKWLNQITTDVKIFFLSRENRGVSKTLNELIGLSNGEFIVPVASDDYIIPGGVKNRIEYLKANKDKYAVFGDAIVIDEFDSVIHESALYNVYLLTNKEQ